MDISQVRKEITMEELPHGKDLKPFKEIAEKEKLGIIEEKLPRGKKSYTPEELCQILTPEELCKILSPGEICAKFTPREVLNIFRPDGLRWILSSDQLSRMNFAPRGSHERVKNRIHRSRVYIGKGHLERGKEKCSC